MDWERKFSTIVKDTESNLERVKAKLDSSIGGFNPNNLSTSQSLQISQKFGPEPLEHQRMLDSGRVARMDAGQRDYVPVEWSSSLVVLLSDKIDAQQQMIGQLSHRLEHSERERLASNRELQQFKDDLRQLQSKVAMGTVDMATDRSVEGLREELKNVQREIRSLKNKDLEAELRGDRAECSSEAVEDFKKIIQKEFHSVKRELAGMSRRIDNVETDMRDFQLSIAVGYKNRTTVSSTYELGDNATPWLSSIGWAERLSPTRVGAKSVSFEQQNAHNKPATAPSLITSHLSNSVLKKKRRDSERHVALRDSDDSDTMSDGLLAPTSPAVSDIDISMLTTEPASERNPSTSRKYDTSDYLFTEDITTDLSLSDDEGLSLEDL